MRGTLGQDAEISRHHARIARSGGAFMIEDLGSTNGTFVNGRRISKPEILSPGDRIQVGATTLVVQVSVPCGRERAAVTSCRHADGPAPSAHLTRHRRRAAPRCRGVARPPLSLQLDFDPAAGEVTLRLDDESDPVRLVYENGRWVLAPNDSPG